ncbi:hypothetical protein I315_04665 [Cryptococcus gattii Ru294]|nr:hypothetical protein I315_04665 [Cryptococcus gattii Ru294]
MFTVGLSTLIFLAGNVFQAITLLIVSIFIFVIYRRADRILNAATNANRDLIQYYPSIHPALIQIFVTVGLFFVLTGMPSRMKSFSASSNTSLLSL